MSNPSPAPITKPIALTEEQFLALAAAAHPLAPQSRGPFLEECARALAALPELDDGVLHRTIACVQKAYFDPPHLDGGRMPRMSKWER